MNKKKRLANLHLILGRLIATIRHTLGRARFTSSDNYWKIRYARGGTSGSGSYNELAKFKAEVINDFITEHDISGVIEFGCGDGNQLSYATYPRYLGLDISSDAIALCERRFAHDQTKAFLLLPNYNNERAELALSLDVIYHLVEDRVFEQYMRMLFCAATRFVVIYSSDTENNDGNEAPHVRHRKFSSWVRDNAPTWKLIRTVRNRFPYDGDDVTSAFSDFFIYERDQQVRRPSRTRHDTQSE